MCGSPSWSVFTRNPRIGYRPSEFPGADAFNNLRSAFNNFRLRRFQNFFVNGILAYEHAIHLSQVILDAFLTVLAGLDDFLQTFAHLRIVPVFYSERRVFNSHELLYRLDG